MDAGETSAAVEMEVEAVLESPDTQVRARNHARLARGERFPVSHDAQYFLHSKTRIPALANASVNGCEHLAGPIY